MSLNKLSVLKLKKKCQETLYKSIADNLEIEEGQTYIPAFSHVLNFENSYSKKMFIFNSKFLLLEVLQDSKESHNGNEDTNIIPKNNDMIRKKNKKEGSNLANAESKLQFKISESLQGKIRGKIVNKNLYSKSKCKTDYDRFVAEIPMFIKSNPLIDVINYMEGKHNFKSEIPSIFSYHTNKKINDVNNNAYLEVICAYFLNLLQENRMCSLFPNFYGAFNGIAKNYVHDISEDYPHIRGCEWFEEKSETLKYTIIKNNNLEGYQELSLKNVEKIDYKLEKNLQHKKNMEQEINGLEIDHNLDLNFESLNLDEPLDISQIDLNSVDNTGVELNLENLEKILPDSIENNKSSESDTSSKQSKSSNQSDNSSSDWSSISSEGSCIFAETHIKIENFPVQILAMESLHYTLTNLVKKGINAEEWKSILFEICFGLAVAQKHFSFIHNDLHSDNIMFKTTKLEDKFYEYKNKYYKVPTYGRETKIIDFARGIIQVGGKTYFSDVFKNEGDAGGQYKYLDKKKNKKYNFHFDLARLASTITEFLEGEYKLKEVMLLVKSWCLNKNGESFLTMDDDFSLYVKIAETANNALPKEQLQHRIFQTFIIDKTQIPEKTHIYKL